MGSLYFFVNSGLEIVPLVLLCPVSARCIYMNMPFIFLKTCCKTPLGAFYLVPVLSQRHPTSVHAPLNSYFPYGRKPWVPLAAHWKSAKKFDLSTLQDGMNGGMFYS